MILKSISIIKAPKILPKIKDFEVFVARWGERTNKTLFSLDRAKASQRYIGILSKTLEDRSTI